MFACRLFFLCVTVQALKQSMLPVYSAWLIGGEGHLSGFQPKSAVPVELPAVFHVILHTAADCDS